MRVDFDKYELRSLEEERDLITGEAYEALETMRREWRADGDDMAIAVYEDGQTAIIRHPLHGEPPQRAYIKAAYLRSCQLDRLINEPAAGCA